MDAACLSTIVPVPNPTGGTGATGATGATGGVEEQIPTRDDWKGLKYVNTGSYPISFDESLLSFWGKELAITVLTFGASYGATSLLKAGSAGLRSLGIKGASKIGMEKLAQRIGAGAVGKVAAKETARTASRLSALSAGYFAKYGNKILIPKRTVAGLIGGTVGGAALDFLSGRDSFVITTVEGFIERNMLLGISKGLVNTLDGYVSDDDWACISQILAVIKGGWTVDDSDKAVSAWGELKKLYVESEGEDLIADIQSVSAKMGDVEGFPNMRSVSPLATLNDVDWDLAKAETLRFVDVLERNESNLSQNLAKLPGSYVMSHVEGNYQEIDENGEEVGGGSKKDGEETGSPKKSTY
jgi:hypothetical protein